MEEKIINLEQDIRVIKERNLQVEADKAWELSWTRRIVIAVGIYLIAAFWLRIIGVSNIFQNAVVPAVGYLLSTLSLPFVKQWWASKKR